MLGNPSDGFAGATIAFALAGFEARVHASSHGGVLIEADGGGLEFSDATALVAQGRSGAYPSRGPMALLMAAAKRFAERLEASGLKLEGVGFRLRLVDSSIPPEVGLAGSSAIVIATLRALGVLFRDEVPDSELPAVALACEDDELGIAAGPQDRVVQTHGGLLFMDFGSALESPSHPWVPERLDPVLLPPLLVAYDPEATGHSGSVHASVRERYDAGDPAVIETMGEIAALAHAGRVALLGSELGPLPSCWIATSICASGSTTSTLATWRCWRLPEKPEPRRTTRGRAERSSRCLEPTCRSRPCSSPSNARTTGRCGHGWRARWPRRRSCR
ncbi:MAG TPA: hypothetical protein VHJ54_10200 [Solirubrobacterales bacterium]|nr:hypothetical protein [Solirubrobacterales bacterium]